MVKLYLFGTAAGLARLEGPLYCPVFPLHCRLIIARSHTVGLHEGGRYELKLELVGANILICIFVIRAASSCSLPLHVTSGPLHLFLVFLVFRGTKFGAMFCSA